MKQREEYTCSLEMTHDITRGKWKPILLWQLGKGGQSFSQLKRDIAGISEKMLLQHLGELQQYNMVGKTQFEGYPLRVEYYLTQRGKKMLQVVEIMQQIGMEMMEENGGENPL